MKKSSFSVLAWVLIILAPTNLCFADAILAEISKKLTKYTITQGKFNQEKRLTFLTKPLISNGEFSYLESKGVIWETKTPIQSTLVITDSGIQSGEANHAMPPAFGNIFKALLGGQLQGLDQQFNVVGSQQSNSWRLVLTPKDDMLKKVILTITVVGDSDIREWALQETGGNLTRIQFSDMRHPDKLDTTQAAKFEAISP